MVAETTGDIPEELEAFPLPGVVAYLWEWFAEVSGARSVGSPSLTVSEIKVWAEVMKGVEITAFEIKALRALDRSFMTQKTDANV